MNTISGMNIHAFITGSHAYTRHVQKGHLGGTNFLVLVIIRMQFMARLFRGEKMRRIICCMYNNFYFFDLAGHPVTFLSRRRPRVR